MKISILFKMSHFFISIGLKIHVVQINKNKKNSHFLKYDNKNEKKSITENNIYIIVTNKIIVEPIKIHFLKVMHANYLIKNF